MKERVFMVCDNYSSFVRRDAELLSSTYEIITLEFKLTTKYQILFLYPLYFFKMIRGAIQAKAVLVQGGGFHSFIASIACLLVRKPLAIIVIGTDAIRMPEIDYGHFTRKFLAACTAFSYRRADMLLPVHRSLISYTYEFDKVKYQQQGIRAFVKDLKTPIRTIENGYDQIKWCVSSGVLTKEGSFLTVASAKTMKRFLVKGLDLFMALAERFQGKSFTIVGHVPKNVQLPPNIQHIPFTQGDELRAVFSAHQFYMQLSRSEGFPNALCEAMLCGCIPIVTDVGGQADIVKNSGVVFKTLERLRQVDLNNLPSSFSEDPRAVIKSHFTLEKRKNELLQVLAEF